MWHSSPQWLEMYIRKEELLGIPAQFSPSRSTCSLHCLHHSYRYLQVQTHIQTSEWFTQAPQPAIAVDNDRPTLAMIFSDSDTISPTENTDRVKCGGNKCFAIFLAHAGFSNDWDKWAKGFFYCWAADSPGWVGQLQPPLSPNPLFDCSSPSSFSFSSSHPPSSILALLSSRGGRAFFSEHNAQEAADRAMPDTMLRGVGWLVCVHLSPCEFCLGCGNNVHAAVRCSLCFVLRQRSRQLRLDPVRQRY